MDKQIQFQVGNHRYVSIASITKIHLNDLIIVDNHLSLRVNYVT